MKNPFVYGKEVAGDNFCNRKKETHELCRDIENSQNVIIFSQRRYGKTSLIKRVFELSKHKGIVTVYADLYPVLTEEDFISIYAGAIAESILGKTKKNIKNIAQFFKKIRPKFTLNQNGEVSYTIDIEKKEILPSLEDALDSINRYANSKKKKAVVCFDEFQQIALFKTDKAEKTMRSLFQKHKNISYIFMGSKKHLISDIFNSPNRPFYRSGKSFPLGKIDKSELSEFIRKKFELSHKVLSDNLANDIIDICECHPYYVQYLCHIIWERAIDKKNITEEDFSKSLGLLLERESSTYEATWNLLTLNQKQALMALSKMLPEDKLFSHEFLKKHNLGSASSLQRTLISLVEKDLIDKEGDSNTIMDVFFKKWLAEI
jgi:uncharacterized protein